MGMLIDGEWHPDANQSTDGEAFDRQETTFRDRVRDDPDARFRPEPGRYHLYVARPCPWAHRAVLARRLMGLTDAVTMDVVDPIRLDDGWEFSPDEAGCTPDTVNGADYLREVYTAADPGYTGRVTVPVLWDKEEKTIVNNESAEILRMLDTAFADLKERPVDLYPEGYREAVDRIVDDIYAPINDGVYRAGFAGSQDAHERAVRELFDALERWETVLGERRYLAGEVLTEADLCLFTTLVRFDEVYHTHFKCNVRRLVEFPNLWGHTRELYQLPGVAETVDMTAIKEHYYRTHTDTNPRQLVPLGPDPDFEAPHDRDRLPGGPPDALAE